MPGLHGIGLDGIGLPGAGGTAVSEVSPLSYPLSFPDVTSVSSIKLELRSSVPGKNDPYTFQSKTDPFDAQRWEGEIRTHMEPDSTEGRKFRRFLTALRGSLKTFNMAPPSTRRPRGNAAVPTSATVDGANQTGRSLDTTGWAVSTTILKRGDYFQVGNELKQITEDISSDGSGNATLVFEPILRSSPGDGDSITIDEPEGRFRLKNPTNEWTEIDFRVETTFEFAEAVLN